MLLFLMNNRSWNMLENSHSRSKVACNNEKRITKLAYSVTFSVEACFFNA